LINSQYTQSLLDELDQVKDENKKLINYQYTQSLLDDGLEQLKVENKLLTQHLLTKRPVTTQIINFCTTIMLKPDPFVMTVLVFLPEKVLKIWTPELELWFSPGFIVDRFLLVILALNKIRPLALEFEAGPGMLNGVVQMINMLMFWKDRLVYKKKYY
jgi:hypothetical protein